MPEELTAVEIAVLKWQYGMNGDFKAALWEAIKRADEGNLNLLSLGFPYEVQGYLKYTRELDWWQMVQVKAKQNGCLIF